ncbi:MAG: hypothetical protein IJ305_09190 [Oscillospiraceae bacterium]|nr:hypothetical protein [Oscillospiraceae bacterium]
MKNMAKAVMAVVMTAAVLCFAGCNKEKPTSEVSSNVAQSNMVNYLIDKGYDTETDFLAEENVMILDGVKVYVYSWRTPAGENADRLFGMYAISADGKDYYEYQSARGEWILDVDG